jgi:hypothetical protein
VEDKLVPMRACHGFDRGYKLNDRSWCNKNWEVQFRETAIDDDFLANLDANSLVPVTVTAGSQKLVPIYAGSTQWFIFSDFAIVSICSGSTSVSGAWKVGITLLQCHALNSDSVPNN